jgi:hypothetical protein
MTCNAHGKVTRHVPGRSIAFVMSAFAAWSL